MAVEKLPAMSADNGGLVATHEKNRTQVSNTNKPLFFYDKLDMKYIHQHNEVELSALGMGVAFVVIILDHPITSLVTIAEILKNNGVATERRVLTSSSIGMKDENRGRMIQKPSEAKPKAKEQQEKVDAEDKKKEKE